MKPDSPEMWVCDHSVASRCVCICVCVCVCVYGWLQVKGQILVAATPTLQGTVSLLFQTNTNECVCVCVAQLCRGLVLTEPARILELERWECPREGFVKCLIVPLQPPQTHTHQILQLHPFLFSLSGECALAYCSYRCTSNIKTFTHTHTLTS